MAKRKGITISKRGDNEFAIEYKGSAMAFTKSKKKAKNIAQQWRRAGIYDY